MFPLLCNALMLNKDDIMKNYWFPFYIIQYNCQKEQGWNQDFNGKKIKWAHMGEMVIKNKNCNLGPTGEQESKNKGKRGYLRVGFRISNNNGKKVNNFQAHFGSNIKLIL